MRFGAVILGGSLVLAGCEYAPVEGAPGTRGPTAAERNCVSALVKEAEVKRADVTIARSQSVPEGDIVYLQIAGAEKPWRCIADLDGTARSLLNLGAV
jgi:hypothetical protein